MRTQRSGCGRSAADEADAADAVEANAAESTDGADADVADADAADAANAADANASFSEALDAEAERHARTAMHPDALEAGSAFLQKRVTDVDSLIAQAHDAARFQDPRVARSVLRAAMHRKVRLGPFGEVEVQNLVLSALEGLSPINGMVLGGAEHKVAVAVDVAPVDEATVE